MGQNEAAGAREQSKEEFKKQVEELEKILVEHWEYHATIEEGKAPVIKTPAKPTEKEYREHQVTHTPL